MLYRGNMLLHRATCEKKIHAFSSLFLLFLLQMILLALLWRKDSKSVLRFEIGLWEVGEKNWTDRETDKKTDFPEF